MEDAAAPKSSSVAVGVTLFPSDYETIEMITDQGEEIVQQEFSDAQLFMHSIQELERARTERTKKQPTGNKKQKTSNDNAAAAVKAEAARDTDESMLVPVDDATDDLVNAAANDADADAEDDDVIDPRIHYRPMVAELQGAVAELHQLINSIDLIRRREFLEEMRCLRENTAPRKDELDYLLASKTAQVHESSSILLRGVETLTRTVETESVFFHGITHLLQKWKLCAPIHGTIPKPFRAGEPLAVDCSFLSESLYAAGSVFTPQTRTIADLAFAELSRTDKGLVRIKTPDEFLARTIQLQLTAVATSISGSYTLPSPQIIKLSKAQLDALTNTPDDVAQLNARNASVLHAVQFSVFCEELFQTLMVEALQRSANWTDTAYNISNYYAAKPSSSFSSHSQQQRSDSNAAASISVLQVLDDEIQLRVNEKYHLAVKLVDVSTMAATSVVETETETEAQAADDNVTSDALDDSKDAVKQEDGGDDASSAQQLNQNGHAHVRKATASTTTPSARHASVNDEAFLAETCRFSLLLLAQEIRHRHGRKDIARALLYTGADSTTTNANVNTNVNDAADKATDASTGTLATVLAVLAHNLLKEEVTRYLDTVSATLAFQNRQVSASGRVLEDGLLQPICDSVRGVYVSPRWKVCGLDSTLSAFDLSIGKNFTTEVLLTGTRIRFEDGHSSVREVSGLVGLAEFIEKTVCTQVALALHRDALSFGLKQATMDLDRASVRLFSAKEWNGTSIGDGRVSDTKAVGSIYFEPFFARDGSLAISCMLQAVDTTALVGEGVLTGSSSLTTSSDVDKSESSANGAAAIASASGDVHSIDWKRIPGQSDAGKLAWLLQKTDILSDVLAPRRKSAGASSNISTAAATMVNGTSG